MAFIKIPSEIINTLVSQGKSYTEIASQFGVTKQRISQIIRERNLPPKMKKGSLPKPISALESRKDSFVLGSDFYSAAAEKYRRKKQNTSGTRHEFVIKFEEIEWNTHCPILGMELDYSAINPKKVENSVSFDRIDSSKGYIPGNVQIISWRANRIKNDGTAEEHRKIANYMDKLNNK